MIKRLMGIALLVLCAPWVWAQDYYWKLDGYSSIFTSASAACDYYFGIHESLNSIIYKNISEGMESSFKDGRIGFLCKVTEYYMPGGPVFHSSHDGFVARYGDSCPAGKTYNAEKGACQFQKTPEQCAAIDGQTFYTYSSASTSLNFCHKGCSAYYAVAICGNPTCSFNAVYTGSICEEGQDDLYSPADDNPPTNDNDDNDNQPDPNHPDPDHCPPGYYYGGTQCNKIEAPNDGCPEGQVKQGDNGHCVTPDPNTPPPTDAPPGSGNDNGGGNSDIPPDPDAPKADDSAQTNDPDLWDKCPKGYIHNGSFCSPVPDSSGKCPKGYSKHPDFNYCRKSGSNNGGGGGNGNGDCKEGEDCKDKQSKVSGESCDVDLTCEGDAVQCAILKQQKQQACRLENDHEHHGQMVSENEAQEAADKAAFEENSNELPVGNLFNEAKNSSGWLPKSCPAPRTASIGGRTMSFDFSPFCQFATGIAPIIVLMASLFFLITVGRAVKG